ncbi:hypothetical protein SDC9_122953 [bioreactor metagenome]|jgi:hypothetical protein|uniref:Uncharacterized protein n=1 Tax=bioreactor metagenome TaxID=1076179 RepID=A0A645CGE9_9ZZZZ
MKDSFDFQKIDNNENNQVDFSMLFDVFNGFFSGVEISGMADLKKL